MACFWGQGLLATLRNTNQQAMPEAQNYYYVLVYYNLLSGLYGKYSEETTWQKREEDRLDLLSMCA